MHRFRIALPGTYFRAVDAEALYLDQGPARLYRRRLDVLIDELVDAAGFIDDDRFHPIPPYVPNYPDAFHHPDFKSEWMSPTSGHN